ncbi:DeoR family transcriptional regulator [Streptomyces sp. NPDC098789]|uniref:DeoR family transcriptional regulator n=1 Tax=Streptomyces sp. NPDC098789 TaxID=3366098 RepID=UPI0038011440
MTATTTDPVSRRPGDISLATGKLRRDARRRLVVGEVVRRGHVDTADLVRRLAVSRMTVHRDLRDLAAQGSLHRVRGGAVAPRTTM